MTQLLILNAGSTSLKYAVVSYPKGKKIQEGVIENIGTGRIRNHNDACKKILEQLRKETFSAVAHRYVHGAGVFQKPVVVTPVVLQRLVRLHHFAPLHNPVQYTTLTTARTALPNIPHVVFFDTMFHRTLSFPHNAYALPEQLVKKYHLRQFGFHGLSHEHARNEVARKLQKKRDAVNAISIHLGGGSSVCAIQKGQSMACSMGYSPLSGAVMMSRAGDIDPAIIFTLQREARLTPQTLEKTLNLESGMLAFTGTKDFRKVIKSMNKKNLRAQKAFAIYVASIQKYVAFYTTVVHPLDAIIFTGAIGAGSAEVRKAIMAPAVFRGIRVLSAPAEEELIMAEMLMSHLALS